MRVKSKTGIILKPKVQTEGISLTLKIEKSLKIERNIKNRKIGKVIGLNLEIEIELKLKTISLKRLIMKGQLPIRNKKIIINNLS